MRKEYSHKTFNYEPLDITIFCNVYETQYNWGHQAYIKDENYHTLSYNKITYYNRTWESYGFQSVILGAITNIIESLKQSLYDEYKKEHNKKRLTREEKNIIIDTNDEIQLYKTMYNYFKNLNVREY